MQSEPLADALGFYLLSKANLNLFGAPAPVTTGVEPTMTPVSRPEWYADSPDSDAGNELK